MDAFAGIGVKPGVSNLDILALEPKLLCAPALEKSEALGIIDTLEGVVKPIPIDCIPRAAKI